MPRADESFLTAVRPAGLPVRPRLVSDLAVAFSSATPAPEGYVLVAGTGAVAGRLVAGELLERRDGWGWLLGDEGSGFWLGREAVRATLARLQSGTKPLGPLAEAVIRLAGSRDPVAIVQLCYANPPVWLSTFAELVARHAEDPVAAAIADRAADAPARHPARTWTSIPSSRWCSRVRWPPDPARSATRCGRVSTSG